MFDFNNPNAMRRPLAAQTDVIPSTFVPPAPISPFMEMPAPPPPQGNSSGSNIGSLLQAGATAYANRGAGIKSGSTSGGSTEGKAGGGVSMGKASLMGDAPMPKMKRPFEIGPPLETYA